MEGKAKKAIIALGRCRRMSRKNDFIVVHKGNKTYGIIRIGGVVAKNSAAGHKKATKWSTKTSMY